MDGRSKDIVESSEVDLLPLKKVTSNPPSIIGNQIINATEAALINHFKPKYNDKFKNNFPDLKHKDYQFYYDYNYNSICVELDPACINLKIFSELKVYDNFKSIVYTLDSDEKRKSIFE